LLSTIDDEAPISAIARSFLPRQTSHSCRKSHELAKCGKRLKIYACKVCSLLNERHETTYYCEECSSDDGKIWLCNMTRRTALGNTQTCWNLWHLFWYNGTKIPQQITRAIRRRKRRSIQPSSSEGSLSAIQEYQSATPGSQRRLASPDNGVSPDYESEEEDEEEIVSDFSLSRTPSIDFV
jgi:hypothetical protein